MILTYCACMVLKTLDHVSIISHRSKSPFQHALLKSKHWLIEDGYTNRWTRHTKESITKNSCENTLCTHHTLIINHQALKGNSLTDRYGCVEIWMEAHTEDEELTSAGLWVTRPALFHHTFTQVRLFRRWLTASGPSLNPASALTAALRPLTPHTPATWRNTCQITAVVYEAFLSTPDHRVDNIKDVYNVIMVRWKTCMFVDRNLNRL